MKKFRNALILLNLLLLWGNSSFAATTTTSISYTKYIAIGVAALIIILLLFLGYKMDTKDSDYESNYIRKSSKKETRDANLIEEETKYEEDNVSYEKDAVNTDDLVDNKEYNEDEDSDLFSYSNEEEEGSLYDASRIGLGIDENVDDLEDEPINKIEEQPEEEYGEEFDTSILDSIDDEDEFNNKINAEINSKEDEEISTNDTMIFDTPPADIPDLDLDLDNIKEEETELDLDLDLDNIKKEETELENFSTISEKEEKEEKEKKVTKPKRKYTKSKKTGKSEK